MEKPDFTLLRYGEDPGRVSAHHPKLTLCKRRRKGKNPTKHSERKMPGQGKDTEEEGCAYETARDFPATFVPSVFSP